MVMLEEGSERSPYARWFNGFTDSRAYWSCSASGNQWRNSAEFVQSGFTFLSRSPRADQSANVLRRPFGRLRALKHAAFQPA